jgi:hypothetical protein
MNWLFDSPFTILLGALAVGFFLGVAWVQTGRNLFLYCIGGVAAVAVLLLILERRIETDGEKVTRLLYQIAGEIQANDAESVMRHIVSSKPELAEQGRREMKNHSFSNVTITKIHSVEEFPNKQPPSVVAEFNVLVAGDFMKNDKSLGGGITMEGRPIFFKLTFWKDHDGEWRIADYEYDADRPFPKSRGN